VSLKAGRFDLTDAKGLPTYGRGWILLDGTPLDGSRSIYNDGAILTIHDLEEAFGLKDSLGPTSLDLIGLSNKGDENRLTTIQSWPFSHQYDYYTSEYDTNLLGAYLTSKYTKGHEAQLYYIYKDDERAIPLAAAIPFAAERRARPAASFRASSTTASITTWKARSSGVASTRKPAPARALRALPTA